ncbi:hypothetical protein Cadr_000008319 [Camelus dromedarius]|uniref:Uncharacterized protein n=1 Tax=Camelus dromedarius TaxID=9838 RepID=A0A5N4DXT9_CAMDR|nr:hypothetical protein Cadr_000008319 [Camelus dromedarius]
MDTQRAPRTGTHQAHTRPVHRHQLPLQAAEAATPGSHPQVWPGRPSHLASWPQMAPPREAQPPATDKVLERAREANPTLRKMGEIEEGLGLRHHFCFPQTPRVSVSVSLPHAGDTLRTSAYLCVVGPAWISLSELPWLPWLPWIKVRCKWGYPTCPLRRLMSLPGSGRWEGTPSGPWAWPGFPRPRTRRLRHLTAPSLKAGNPPALPESLLLTCIDVIASLGFPWKHWRAQNKTVCNPAANCARQRAHNGPHPPLRLARADTRTHPLTMHNTPGSVYLGQALPAFGLFQGPNGVCVAKSPGQKDRSRTNSLLQPYDPARPAGGAPSLHTPIPTHLYRPEQEGLLSQEAGAPLRFFVWLRRDPTCGRNPAGIQPVAKPHFGAPVPFGIGRELTSDGSTEGQGCCHGLQNRLCWGAIDFFERHLAPALGRSVSSRKEIFRGSFVSSLSSCDWALDSRCEGGARGIGTLSARAEPAGQNRLGGLPCALKCKWGSKEDLLKRLRLPLPPRGFREVSASFQPGLLSGWGGGAGGGCLGFRGTTLSRSEEGGMPVRQHPNRRYPLLAFVDHKGYTQAPTH